jgi:fatty acid desaturase
MPVDAELKKLRIPWYRSPVDRQTLDRVNQRSDWLGLLQTLGYLGLLVVTAAVAFYAAAHWAWPVLLLVLYVHGTFYAFLLNGFHELVHKTVFKTKALNTVFLYIFSFLAWLDPIFFWASHQEHHKYTLHPPADLEVVLPVKLTYVDFLKVAIISPWLFVKRMKEVARLSFGRLDGEWENHLFPASDPERRRRLFTWSRILLGGQLLLTVVSLYFGLWLLPVLITLAAFYGNGLQWLCNNTQHSGLQNNVADFRLCTRTILLNPFLRFLYWHMNYHIEHHMFAAVPCYNLGKLHAAIERDLPPSPNGIIAAWREIIPILRRQQIDPTYQFVVRLPPAGR